jgi:hypothetical protein
MSNTMFLTYPGMSDFEEVEILSPAEDAGFCYVRAFGSDAELKVHTSRLVDAATALRRTRTETTTVEHSDWINGSWISTTTTRTVTAI